MARASFGVRGLRLVADGIPASTPDGQGQLGLWLIGDAARSKCCAALLGPLRQRQRRRHRTAKPLANGSANASRAQPRRLRPAADEPQPGPPAAEGQALSLTAQLTHRDGFRPHSGSERRLAPGPLAAAHARAATAARRPTAKPARRRPLGLTAEQFAANSRQTAPQASSFNTRKTAEQQQLGLRWLREVGADLRVQIASWAGHRAVDQWQSIPLSVQNAPSHPGGVIALNRRFGGVDARLNWALADAHELTPRLGT